MTPAATLTVLKLGGELLEEADRVAGLARAIASMAAQAPLVVVHGGGREIDTECARRGLRKTAVDGLRVTDAATLDAVVTVLGGVVNTRLVAALVRAGVRAVGISGVDAGCVPVAKAPPHRTVDGRDVDLGLVGLPVAGSAPALIGDLVHAGYVPVVACFGADASGQIYNVNADVLAAHLAVACQARRLIVAGSTPGVLDETGATMPRVEVAEIDELLARRTATAGMVAKLLACRTAVLAGVAQVHIVDGRHPDTILGLTGTRLGSAHAVPVAE